MTGGLSRECTTQPTEEEPMRQVLIVAAAFVIALTSATEGSTHKKKRTRPAPERAIPKQLVRDQDEFRSCDVAVRDFVQGRKEAAALPVKEVKVDGLRMTLNFVHPYGESGDTAPNLAFTRAESVDERRRALNETKQRIDALADAAKSGTVWYVIVLKNAIIDESELKRSPATMQPEEARPSASAVVLASMEGKCTTVYEYKTISLDRLNEDLRRSLGEKSREASPADSTAIKPQS
jgi:hypothetical protein